MGPYGFGRYGFARRENRPRSGPAWQFNPGGEANNAAPRAYATGPSTPRTDFSEALKPRLGGMMKPIFDFSVKPSTISQEVAAAGVPLQSSTPGIAQGEASITVPNDGAPQLSMFSDVNDGMGSQPGETMAGPKPGDLAGGFQSSTPDERSAIRNNYPANNFAMQPAASWSGVDNPYQFSP